MTILRLVVNEHQSRNGGASDTVSLNFGTSSLQDQWSNLINCQNLTVGQYVANTIKWELQQICNDWGNCDYMPSGHAASAYKPTLYIGSPSQAEVDWWNNNIAGKSITLTFKRIQIDFTSGAVRTVNDWLKWKVSSLPTITTTSSHIPSEECLYWYGFETINSQYDNDTFCQILGAGNTIRTVYPNFDYYEVDFTSSCDDLRTSSGTNECQISINYLDIDSTQQTSRYTLMFQPDVNNTSGSVSNIGWLPFTSIVGASCHFVRGGVRGSGTIIIRGRLYGTIEKAYSLGPDSIKYLDYIDENVILLQASFSPCCDYPDMYSETYTEVLEDSLDGLIEDDVYALNCEVTSIEWSGFENLTNYCCDDSDCSNDDFEYPPNNGVSGGSGESGGGGESGEGGGTDPCICEWLESIDTKLGLIDNSLSALLCICTSLDTLTGVLRGKELSVTNQITVTPSTAQITTPVNAPVTVNPPVNQITVTPSTAQVTTPVNAPVTVTPAPVTVNPTDLTGLISAINGLQLSASVTNNIDGLTCENSLGQQESLACIIKNALNYNGMSISEIQKKAFSKYDDCCDSDKWLVNGIFTENDDGCLVSLADLIKNKEFGSFFDVTIDGTDLVNYRKVFKDPLD